MTYGQTGVGRGEGSEMKEREVNGGRRWREEMEGGEGREEMEGGEEREEGGERRDVIGGREEGR